MTVAELIELLRTFPEDAPVALPHYYDCDAWQFDVINHDSVSLDYGAPRGNDEVLARSIGVGIPVVVIR